MFAALARAPFLLAVVPTVMLGASAVAPRTLEQATIAPSTSLTVGNAPRVQAAATRDGFLVLERSPLQRIVPIGFEGGVGDSVHLPRLPVDARAVGLRNGERALVYQNGRIVQLDAVGPDGELAKLAEFGKRVYDLCDGLASNEHRFGVAWTEHDGAVWFVHGPTGASVDATAEVWQASPPSSSASTGPDAAPRQPVYCGIASAGDQIALLWQEGSGANLVHCNQRRCTRNTTLRVPSGRTIRSFGCTPKACTVAMRTPDGATEVAWVASNGRIRWTKRVTETAELSMVGAGRDHIAIGHMRSSSEAGLVVVDEAGKGQLVWTGAADGVPSLVWSKDRLLFARHAGGQLAIGIMKKQPTGAWFVER